MVGGISASRPDPSSCYGGRLEGNSEHSPIARLATKGAGSEIQPSASGVPRYRTQGDAIGFDGRGKVPTRRDPTSRPGRSAVYSPAAARTIDEIDRALIA